MKSLVSAFMNEAKSKTTVAAENIDAIRQNSRILAHFLDVSTFSRGALANK